MKLNYNDNKQIIKSFYNKLGLADEFAKDSLYLEKAFNGINDFWIENFEKIEKVNYLMISESPLWGHKKKYIYNRETNQTEFFYRSYLEKVLKSQDKYTNIQLKDQKQLIETCNEIGLLIVDLSPFPLNSIDTKVNYREDKHGSVRLDKKKYKELIGLTLPTFFEKQLKLVAQKKSPEIKVFFRYARVRDACRDLISGMLIENGFIKSQEEIGDIAPEKFGGIDDKKFLDIINAK